ncbi:MAG: hypothetical protein AB7G93_06045 [Bdellovibrionales bacterium]
MAGIDENKAFVAHAETFRAKVSQSCCDGNTRCLQAMREVKILICQPPHDQNAPDGCSGSPGYFDFSEQERFQLYRNLILGIVRSKEMNNVDKQWAGQQLAQFPGNFYERNRENIIAGNIVLSPYLSKEGQRYIGDVALVHEFVHACSSIRRQIMVLDSASGAAIDSLMKQSFMGENRERCKLRNDVKQIFVDMMSPLPDGIEIGKCLVEGTAESLNPKSFLYHKDNCATNILEEGFAQAFSLALEPANLGRTGAYQTCWTVFDRIHMAGPVVTECLLQHSARWSAKAKESMGCGNEGKR